MQRIVFSSLFLALTALLVGEASAVHKKGQKARPSLSKVRPLAQPRGLQLIGVSDSMLNPNGPGILVLSVDPNSLADVAGLDPGDVILKADNVITNTPVQVSGQILRDIANQQPSVELTVIDVNTGGLEVVSVFFQPFGSALKKK